MEFSNILVLNKTDLVSEEELFKLEDIVHALNPDALLKRTQFGRMPLEEILNTHLFDFGKASTSAGIPCLHIHFTLSLILFEIILLIHFCFSILKAG